MIQDIDRLIKYIQSDASVSSSITSMSIDDFTDFISQSGFSFSMDDFVKTMKELDRKKYANNHELSDQDLDSVSAGSFISISQETLDSLMRFCD